MAVGCHPIKAWTHHSRSNSPRCPQAIPARKSMPSNPTEETAARWADFLEHLTLSTNHRLLQRLRCRNTLVTVRRTHNRPSSLARTSQGSLKARSSTDSHKPNTTPTRRMHRCTASNRNNTSPTMIRRRRTMVRTAMAVLVECPCPHRTSQCGTFVPETFPDAKHEANKRTCHGRGSFCETRAVSLADSTSYELGGDCALALRCFVLSTPVCPLRYK